jgi:hypothetical protein
VGQRRELDQIKSGDFFGEISILVGTSFAFVRGGGSAGDSAAGLAMRRSSVNASTSLTVLTDGAAGLRAIQRGSRQEPNKCWIGFTSAPQMIGWNLDFS